MQSDIQHFIDFVELDQRLDRLVIEQDVLTKKVAGIELEIQDLKQESEDALHALHVVRKQLDAVELELKAIVDKRNQTASKLQRAASPKEFFSLESELKDLEKKQAPLDEHGLELLTELEKAQIHYEIVKAQEPEKREGLQQKYDALLKDRAYGADLIKAYNEQKSKAEVTLPEEMLANYKAMKAKVVNPVVPLLKGSCSACFYAVSQPDIVELAHGKLVQCRDCYRLLYMTQQPENNYDDPDAIDRG